MSYWLPGRLEHQWGKKEQKVRNLTEMSTKWVKNQKNSYGTLKSSLPHKRTISHEHLVTVLMQLEITGTIVITVYLQLLSFIPNDLKQLHLLQNFHRNKNRSKPAAINGNTSKSSRGLWIKLIFHSKYSPLLYQTHEYSFWLTYKILL